MNSQIKRNTHTHTHVILMDRMHTPLTRETYGVGAITRVDEGLVHMLSPGPLSDPVLTRPGAGAAPADVSLRLLHRPSSSPARYEIRQQPAVGGFSIDVRT